ncbi:MAG: preprotein translocase subunit SecE [Thermodesulfobacteriota bacterium]
MASSKAKSGKKNKMEVEQSSSMSPANIKKFIDEVKVEFTKIVWPARKVTLGLTGVVIVLTIVVSCYLGAVDLLLGKLISSVLR